MNRRVLTATRPFRLSLQYRRMKTVFAYLALFICCFLTCGAQSQTAPAPQRSSAPPPSTKTDDSMVFIRGGTFQMGIAATDIPRLQKIFAIENAKLFQDELPRHTVTVKDFYLDKNLVTNAEFKAFIAANPQFNFARVSENLDNGNYLQHWDTPEGDNAKPDHPVVNVNWYAATMYCRWAGKRLPTEAEWEFAARGGKDALFPWGDEPPNQTRANFNNNVGTTTPVGVYPANPYGLYDMAGNVWQFLSDKWAPYSFNAEKKKQQDTHAKHNADSSGIGRDLFPDKPRHVIRGGSYAGASINLWLEYRDSHPANGSQPFVGFRCAKSAATGTPLDR
jgi:sulfatase modifying factor 1